MNNITYSITLSKGNGPCGSMGFMLQGDVKTMTVADMLNHADDKCISRYSRFRIESMRNMLGQLVNPELVPGEWLDFENNKNSTLFELGYNPTIHSIALYD